MIKRILFLILFFSAFTVAQAIGPKVTIPQINYDYSQVPENTTFQHDYMIYNGGGGVLKLLGVSSSCKCITASLDRNTLTPTDSARLNVSFSNTGISKGTDNFITLKTNDPNNPELRVFITRAVPTGAPTLSSMPVDTAGGAVLGPVIFLPETEHDFGKMKQGDIGKYTFKIINKGTGLLRIKDITTSCGCTAAVVNDKDIPAGKEGEISVQFDSSGKMGKLSRRITVFSNDPKSSYKNITIYADVETAKE
ncbi:MAG: DUF1573 domain-containing protein [Ignavibacteriaceae bacterium]